MNEEQADSQYKLSRGIPRGRNSVNNSEDDDGYEENPSQKSVRGGQNGGKTISKSVFIAMIVVGLLLDVLGVVPVIGWFTSSVILIGIYIKLGVEFHFKNILKFGGCDALKLIPGVSIIPTFTLAVILNLLPIVDNLGGSIPGGENIANKVQKAISMTKK